MIVDEGLHAGLSYEEYDRIMAVRWTVLRFMGQSAAAYMEQLLNGRGETTALRLGRAIHCLLLEPEAYPDQWATWTGERRRSKAWDAFRSLHAGKGILTKAESDQVVQAVAAVRRHKVARRYLDGAAEQVAVWTDPSTNLKCKSRSDIVGPTKYIELKSTQMSVEPAAFGRLAARMQYHVGMAFHLDGMRTAGAPVDEQPLLIAVEAKPPYDCVVFLVGEALIAAGRNEYQRLLGRVDDCIKAELAQWANPQAPAPWPGHAPDHIVPLELPSWAFSDKNADYLGLDLTGLATGDDQ